MTIDEYINKHTGRLCACCAEKEDNEPDTAVIDVVFFKMMALGDPKAEELRELVKNYESPYGPIDLFDGNEHSYLEIGGLFGDQGLALRLMGLGDILGLWKLMTPRTIRGATLPKDLVERMAGVGYVTIMAPKASDEKR